MTGGCSICSLRLATAVLYPCCLVLYPSSSAEMRVVFLRSSLIVSVSASVVVKNIHKHAAHSNRDITVIIVRQ